MTETRQTAGEMSAKLAIDAALLLQFLIGVLQAASICLPKQTSPEEAIQKLAIKRPRRVEKLIDRISRRKRIPAKKRDSLRIELMSQLRDKKQKDRLARVCAEVKKLRG